MPFVDLATVRFESPERLWLLAIPLVLLPLWMWQVIRRGRDMRRLQRSRTVPLRETVHVFGSLLFWLCLVLAMASTIVAVARPSRVSRCYAPRGRPRRPAGRFRLDARARCPGNRWQRRCGSARLRRRPSWRTIASRWRSSRTCHATDRFTIDPNRFLLPGHLDDAPPFRLEDDTTWDTNIESGIHWAAPDRQGRGTARSVANAKCSCSSRTARPGSGRSKKR